MYEFKAQLANTLTKCGVHFPKKEKGRPRVKKLHDEKSKRGGPKTFKEVRIQDFGHIPITANRGPLCKYPGCDARPVTMCKKCNVYLCGSKKHCFQDFHCNYFLDCKTSVVDASNFHGPRLCSLSII